MTKQDKTTIMVSSCFLVFFYAPIRSLFVFEDDAYQNHLHEIAGALILQISFIVVLLPCVALCGTVV